MQEIQRQSRPSSRRFTQCITPIPALGWLRLASLVAMVAFVACQSDRGPATAPSRLTPPVPVVLVPDDTNWNSFTTEVGVMVTGDYPHWGIVEPNASRSFGFTLTRTALAGTNWANVLAFDPATPSNLVPNVGDYETSLGRMEFDDSRTYGRLFTSQGLPIPMVAADTVVPPVDPTLYAPPADTGAYPRHPANPGPPMPLPRLSAPNAPRLGSAPGAAAQASGQEGDARAWIDFFIVGKQGRTRIRQQLVQAGGVAATSPDGLEEFAVTNAGETYSTSLDRISGAPKVLARFAHGQLVMRETRSYTTYGPDAHALSKSRIEYFEPGSPHAARQVLLDYVNTRLERTDR